MSNFAGIQAHYFLPFYIVLCFQLRLLSIERLLLYLQQRILVLLLDSLKHRRLVLVQNLGVLELLQLGGVPGLLRRKRRLGLVRLSRRNDSRTLLGQLASLLLVLLLPFQSVIRMLLDLFLKVALNLRPHRPGVLPCRQPSRQCRHLQLIEPFVIFLL